MLTVDLGNTRGVIRSLDNLGRIVIPKEFRNELNIEEKDELQIFLLEDGLYVKKK